MDDVNTTLEPAQTLVFEVVIEIPGTTLLFTAIVMAFEVAALGDAHVLLLVTTQVTTSPLAKVELL